MAKKKQSLKVVGLILFIVGLGVCFRAYNISDSYKSQFKQAFTGKRSNEVITLYIFGVSGAAVGLYLLSKK